MADIQPRSNGQQEKLQPQGSRGGQRDASSNIARRNQEPYSYVTPREFFSANPFALMRRMSDEMDRIFGGMGGSASSMGSDGYGWAPAIEVSERAGNYVVHAELPGLKPDEVNVEVANDELIIRGERRSQQQSDEGGLHRSERRYGQFYRRIPLPDGVNTEQVQANFENGVLEITAPLPPQQSHRRQIPIGSNRPKM